jgi:hypothetical protein
MERLKHALLTLQVASAEEVEDAGARQQLYGGDLLTNLLEVRSITETQALQALSLAHTLPCVPPGQLPYAVAAALSTLPRNTLLDLEVYPLDLRDTTLTLATGSALAPGVAEAIGQTYGLQLEFKVAVPARIRQALCRDFAIPLERRVHKAIARLEGNEVFSSSRAPGPLTEPPQFSDLPRPLSLKPGAFFADWGDNETPRHDAFLVETAQQPGVKPNADGAMDRGQSGTGRRTTDGPYRLAPPAVPSQDLLPNRPASSKPASNYMSEPSRRGPYAIAQARRDLAGTRTADQVLRILFTYTTQYFDFLAAFTLRSDELILKRTRGLPDSKPESEPMRLADCPLLLEVARAGLVQLSHARQHPELASLLGLSPDRQLAVLPVVVGNRTPIILIGGFDVGHPTHHHAKQAMELCPFVALALERIIRLRKSKPPGT